MIRIAIALLILGAANAAFAQDLASLERANEKQRKLVFDGDARGMDDFAHPDMLINGPHGRIVTKAQFLESIGTGAITKEKFARTAERMSIVGQVGTVMGREDVVAAPGSRDYQQFGTKPFVRRYTNIFVFIDGRWKFLSRQAAVFTDVATVLPIKR